MHEGVGEGREVRGEEEGEEGREMREKRHGSTFGGAVVRIISTVGVRDSPSARGGTISWRTGAPSGRYTRRGMLLTLLASGNLASPVVLELDVLDD